ncbi:ankyrin repeat and LEM domain-containing protein 1 [Pelodytes ibericus]
MEALVHKLCEAVENEDANLSENPCYKFFIQARVSRSWRSYVLDGKKELYNSCSFRPRGDTVSNVKIHLHSRWRYCKYDSSVADAITQMSSISLLLEAPYDISPISSTRIYRMSPFTRNDNTRKVIHNAVISRQMDQQSLNVMENVENKDMNEISVSTNTIALPYFKPNRASGYGVNSSLAQSGMLSSSHLANTRHILVDNTSHLEMGMFCLDINSLSRVTEKQPERSIDQQAFTKELDQHSQKNDYTDKKSQVDSPVKSTFKYNRDCIFDIYSNSSLTSKTISEKMGGPDVTSPDHVFLYNRRLPTSDNDLEETVVMPSQNLCEGTDKQGASLRSIYDRFQSECCSSQEETSHSSNLNVQDSKDISRHCLKTDGDQMFNCCNSGVSTKARSHRTLIPHKSARETITSQYNTQPIPLPGISDASISDTLPVNHQSSQAGEQSQVINKQLKVMMISTKVRQSSPCSNDTPDTLTTEQDPQVMVENGHAELNVKLRNRMSTKALDSHVFLEQGKIPCFFTPRTKCRLNSSNSCHRNSSLFDEPVEMPQRGRRVKSPCGTQQIPSLAPNADVSRRNRFPVSVVSENAENWGICEFERWNNPPATSILDFPFHRQPSPVKHKPEETVNILDFLTDDLSSSNTETIKSGPHFNTLCGDQQEESPGHTWLTEDGDEEISRESGQEVMVNGYTQFGHPFIVPQFNGSLVHGTVVEAPIRTSVKKARYSFSRLSGVVKSDCKTLNNSQLSTIIDSGTQDVPLSPGGRPVNDSTVEQMEYLYLDNERGHTLIERHIPCTDESSNSAKSSDDTILYDWRDYKINKQTIDKIPSNRVAIELYRLSNNELARKLLDIGEDIGPVTSQNRKTFIFLLDKRLKEQTSKGIKGISGYNQELSLALRTSNIPNCSMDEAALSLEFDQPDKTRKWREGILKSSFNYLLMDPRVTRNLPSRCHTLSQNECFRTFVSAVFYVGKGKRSRPYCHLYEALSYYKEKNKRVCSKVQHIVDIWKCGLGVISLHCFQNTIPVEAYIREACMVDAIGLKMLTNQKKGVYYGQVQSWNPARQRCLGVHLLHRAMQIFLAEGERQLRPPDIQAGR